VGWSWCYRNSCIRPSCAINAFGLPNKGLLGLKFKPGRVCSFVVVVLMPYATHIITHLIWDAVDLTAFFWFQRLYAPHVTKVEQNDFNVITNSVIVIGAVLLVLGAGGFVYNSLKSSGETNRRAESALRTSLVSTYASAQLIFDIYQCFVIYFLVSAGHIHLTDEAFEGRVLCDFFNIATTMMDLVVLKGPHSIGAIMVASISNGIGGAANTLFDAGSSATRPLLQKKQ